MSSNGAITPLPESEASPPVKAVFDKIKRTRGIAEVPLIFRIMAHIPMYLETSWRRVKFALETDGH